MALIRCKECGKEASDGAGKCPNCGAKIRKSAGLLGFLLGAAVLVAMVQCTLRTEKSKEQIAAISASKTTEQRAAEEKQHLADEIRFQKTVIAANAVKKAQRNPDSLVWEDIYANDDASVICLLYRAQNGFGGMNKEHIVFVGGKPSQSGAIWNKRCTGKGFIDMKHVRQAL